MIQNPGTRAPYDLKPRDMERRILAYEMVHQRQRKEGFFIVALHMMRIRTIKSIQSEQIIETVRYAFTSAARPNIPATKSFCFFGCSTEVLIDMSRCDRPKPLLRTALKSIEGIEHSTAGETATIRADAIQSELIA